jgi:cytochrome c biogenesis protein CcmG/thiol:disulfide interchange protein DsbE
VRKRTSAGRSILLCCAFLLASLKTELVAGSATEHPPAPAFSLTDIAGKPLNLSDYKGKVVLLDFWATWCGPCRVEVPRFVDLARRYREQGLIVIGISMDDEAEPVREFYRQYKLNYPVALGNEQLSEQYGSVFSLPTTFLIGRDGRVYAKHLGAAEVSVLEVEVRQLLSKNAATEVVDFKPADRQEGGEPIEAEDAQEVASDVPGVDLTKLTNAQTQAFKKQLEAQKCECGCQLSVLNCRVDDSQCGFSLRIARKQLAGFAPSHH